jgi:ribosomal protein S18 acetylase RimI-like enzyme
MAMLKTYWGIFASGGLGALKRGKAAGDAMAKHHPTQPHAYLFTVGVASAGRGRGLGRRLIEPVLDACDRTGTMAYLENSNPANRRFYASLGFERVELFHATPDSPPLEAMQRLPRQLPE